MNHSIRPLAVSLASVLSLVTSSAIAQIDSRCGQLENAYGPYDFYSDKPRLPIVEGAHFTADVEFFRRELAGPFGGDIDYTLRAFPNHPRALAAMVRLGDREKTERPRGSKYTVYCYLERAIRFRPADPTARLIMATYLLKLGRRAEAIEHLRVAESGTDGTGNFHYNLGLAFFDIGDYSKSLSHAHKASDLGFDLPGLRKKLEGVGFWKEPTMLSPSSPSTENPPKGVDG